MIWLGRYRELQKKISAESNLLEFPLKFIKIQSRVLIQKNYDNEK